MSLIKKNIDTDEFNSNMIKACATLFSDTIREVGLDVTTRIFPGCTVELEIENNLQAKKIFTIAKG